MEKGEEQATVVDVDDEGEMKKNDDEESEGSEEHYGCTHYKRKSKFVVSFFRHD